MAPRFYISVFFSSCVTPQFQVSQGRYGNCPLGSDPAWWCLVRLGTVALRHGCCPDSRSHYRMEEWKEYSRDPCISILGQSQNNPGEAVTEPERIQEHSPSSFAGGQHFLEYLLVVSLKKKRLGDDYEPTITYQFPKVRMEGEVGPEDGGGRTKVCLKGNRGVLCLTTLPGL